MASHALLDAIGDDVSAQRAESIPLTLELARLGVAAQFLFSIRQANHETEIDLLSPFASARMTLRQVHHAIADRHCDESISRLEELRQETARLRNLVAEVDATATVEQTDAFVATHSSTVDQLRRMIEYHALVSPHTPESRKKLVLLALAIIRREPMDAPQPRTVRNALQRLKVLERSEESLDAELIHEAAALRRRVQSTTPSQLPQLRADIDHFSFQVGDALYSLGGLCQVVSIHLLLSDRMATIEREGVRSFDEFLDELDGVVADGKIELAPIVSAATDNIFEEPAAIALLAQVEAELAEAIRDHDFAGRAIYLEEHETIAFTQPATDPEWKSLLARGAVCRTAMDRLARKHSRSSQEGTDEPPPAPRPIALCLVRRALRVERELEDINQNSVVRGDITTAKVATRCVHRIARTRLGLALLADIPPDGRIGQSNESNNGSTHGGEARAADLESRLEQAKLFRDALLRDKAATDAARGDGSAPAAAKATEATPATVAPGRNSTLVIRRAPAPKLKRSTRRLLVVVIVLTIGFHGVRLLGGNGGNTDAGVRVADFSPAVPLEAVVRVDGTLIATVRPTWPALDKEDRLLQVRSLWSEAQQKGYSRLVAVNGGNGVPVAIADESDVKLLDEIPDIPQMKPKP